MWSKVVKMHGLGVPNYDSHWEDEKMSRVQMHFSQRVLGALQKQNMLGSSTLQALSISSIDFTTRWNIFSQKS